MGVNIKVPEQPVSNTTGTPQQHAMNKINNMNQQQAAANKIGGKIIKSGRVKIIKNGGGKIEIAPTNTSTMNVNGLLAKVATSDVNSQSNSEFDNAAFKGGSKRRRTRRRTKKTRGRRHRKTRRHRR